MDFKRIRRKALSTEHTGIALLFFSSPQGAPLWHTLSSTLLGVWQYRMLLLVVASSCSHTCKLQKFRLFLFYSVLFLFRKPWYALQSFLFRPFFYVWFRILFSNEYFHVPFWPSETSYEEDITLVCLSFLQGG